MSRQDREIAGAVDRLYNLTSEEELEMAVIDDVLQERQRQEKLAHGGNTAAFDQTNQYNDWVAYITAYAGRAAGGCARNEREDCDFRENMVKVAALAVAAIEAYDSGWCSD